MPKRKRHEEDSDYIRRKIKKLERKLLKGRHKNRVNNKSSSSDSSPQRSNIEEPDVIESPPEVNGDAAHQTGTDTDAAVNADVVITDQIVYEVPAATEQTSSDQANCAKSNVANPTTDCTLDEIDREILEILGEDPTVEKTYGKDIQIDLALRLKHYTTEGLTKEIRKELTTKYLTPSNCTLIDPPALNAEIKAAIADAIVKRDKGIEAKQKQLASAISALSQAITLYISSKTKDPTMLKLLMDVIRILCDCQHSDSITRKNFVLFALKKEMKSQLQTTKIDKYLFSENLPDILRSAKAINRSVTDLKPAPPAPKPQVQYKKPMPSTSKNWKAPPQARRPQEAPRATKEPAHAPMTRNRPPAASKPSSQRVHQNRR